MRIPTWLTRRNLELDEEDFKAEIEAHLEIEAQERVTDGADPDEARYAALREFGNVTLATEAARRVWQPRWLEVVRDILGDVRHATRSLARTPAFSLTVVTVLTLGIGLNAAVFTMLKALALAPIAGVSGSSKLVTVYGKSNGGRALRLSFADYRDLREQSRAFSDLYGSAVGTVGLGSGRSARAVWAEFVTGNYFQVLGVRAGLGRTILPSDESIPQRASVVVVSEGLWRRDFASDPAIVGKVLEINGLPLTVVGVADRDFHGTTVVYDVELFVPVTAAPDLGFNFGSQRTAPSEILDDRQAAFFYPQGYLRSGITRSTAAAQMDGIWQSIVHGRTAGDGASSLIVVPFYQTPNGAPSYILPTLAVVTVMGVLVLMIACANIAGLVLVRGVSRRGEIGIRLALGAARTRILRLLLVENLVLAAPGAVFGILLAANAIPVLVAYAEALAEPQRLFFNVDVDGVVIGYTVLVACASVLLFGFVPALQSTRVDLVSVINADASPRASARGPLRSALVVAQVAVSLLLLIGAGLVTRTLDAARRTYPGFDASDVVSISLDVKQNRYDRVRGHGYYRQLLERLRRDPSIESATLATYEPLNLLETRAQRVAFEGYDARHDEDLALQSNVVASDYFRTLRIPLVAGREFDERDDEAGPAVVVVNKTLADRFWGSPLNAVGKRLRAADGRWRTVIGVASDVKYMRIDESPRPYFYLPFHQAYRSAMIVHARRSTAAGDGSLDSFVTHLRSHVAALDPDLPVEFGRSMAGRMVGSTIFFNLAATMLTLFGVAGTVLAGLGTYGLVSYVVRESTHEIGVRLALGATGASLIRRFLMRGAWLGIVGAALGTTAAFVLGDLVRHLLFGVSPKDPVSFARALLIVIAGVLIATIIPAWRASRSDALKSLRQQ